MSGTKTYTVDDVTKAIAEHLEVTVWRYPIGAGTVALEARFAVSSTTVHAGTGPHGDQAAQREALEREVGQAKRDTRSKVALAVVEAIKRALAAGTITPGRAGARWTSEALQERLGETLDVDIEHVHAPGAPPGDYFGTRAQTTTSFIEQARARCSEGEAESVAYDLQRETRRNVALRVERALANLAPAPSGP